MKKILTVLLVLAVAACCVACTQTKTVHTSEAHTINYRIYNHSGKAITHLAVSDDSSAHKAEVTFDQGGLKDGETGSISVKAVPGRDGFPLMTVSYQTGSTVHTTHMGVGDAEITLLPETASRVMTMAPEKDA